MCDPTGHKYNFVALKKNCLLYCGCDMQYFLISFSFPYHSTLGCSPNGRFTVPVNILSSYLYALPLSLIIALPPVITANINIL